eukprot:m.164263 g.164263  ORF g.164263 m.164263 type:complete len:424 (+) comp31331_c1_seq1:210-1481(+)
MDVKLRKWIPLVALAVLQAGTVYFNKRTGKAVGGKFPYILGLTQPMFTSTFFGLCCFIRWGLTPSPTYKVDETHSDEVGLIDGSIRPKNGERDSVHTATELWGGTGRWSAMKPRTWLSLVAIGVLLTTHNFCQFAGSRADFVAGPLLVLLEQSVVPVTMVASYFSLGSRYERTHVVGVVLVVVGIVASSGPQLHDATKSKTWAAVLIVFAQIPRAIALVMMERMLKHDRLELFWVWMWANVFELLSAIPLTFANMAILEIAQDEYGKHLRDGYQCLFHDCPDGFLWFIIFVLFVVAAKAAFAVVMISGSASLVWVAATAAVPLADFLFMATPVTREKTNVWYFDLLGLGVVVLGLVLWNLRPESRKNNSNNNYHNNNNNTDNNNNNNHYNNNFNNGDDDAKHNNNPTLIQADDSQIYEDDLEG